MRGKGRKHPWQRPHSYDDENGCWITKKPANPSRGGAREHITHSQPLCKARSKGKGNRKAFDRDVASDYRLYDWAPFGDGGAQHRQGVDIASKVSVSVSNLTEERKVHQLNKDLSFEEAMGIATSLSLATAAAEDEKRMQSMNLFHQQVFSSNFSSSAFGEGSSSSARAFPPLYPVYAPAFLIPDSSFGSPFPAAIDSPPISPDNDDEEEMVLPINLEDIFDESESAPGVQENEMEEISSDTEEDDETEGSVWSWESCEEDDGEEELVENDEFVNVLKGADGWSVISVC